MRARVLAGKNLCRIGRRISLLPRSEEGQSALEIPGRAGGPPRSPTTGQWPSGLVLARTRRAGHCGRNRVLRRGIWPTFGVFLHALDAERGKPKWSNGDLNCLMLKAVGPVQNWETSLSPQGYFAVSRKTLIVPNGRSDPSAIDPATGELKYHMVSRRNGDSRVVVHGDYVFAGKAGVLYADDLRELGREAVREVEGHLAPYIKQAEACDASSSFYGGVAYGAAGGACYAYDLSRRIELVFQGVCKPGGSNQSHGNPPVESQTWKPPVLWRFQVPGAEQAGGLAIRAGERLYVHLGKKVVALENLAGPPRVAWERISPACRRVSLQPITSSSSQPQTVASSASARANPYAMSRTAPQGPNRMTPPGRAGHRTSRAPPASKRDIAWCSDSPTGPDLGTHPAHGTLRPGGRSERQEGRCAAPAFRGGGMARRARGVVRGEPSGFGFPPYLASLIVSEDPRSVGLPGDFKPQACSRSCGRMAARCVSICPKRDTSRSTGGRATPIRRTEP